MRRKALFYIFVNCFEVWLCRRQLYSCICFCIQPAALHSCLTEPQEEHLGLHRDLTGREEYTEELYKKDLHDPGNHDSVITHLEPDILECEVKWALGSITMNKASGGDGIPLELFQTLKDDAVKVLHSICQQIWKTQQWPQD